MSLGEVRLWLKKLEKMQREMGGGEEKDMDEIDTSKMDMFQREQYHVALLMKDIRKTLQEKNDPEAKPLAAAARIARDNDLKKKTNQLVEDRKRLQGMVAKNPKYKGDFQELDHHIKKTQEHLKNDAHGGGGGGGHVRGEAKSLDSLNQTSAPMMSMADDEEFTQLFTKIREKDKQMDQLIDQIGDGVQHLGQSAKVMNDELNKQDKLLDEIEEKVDDIQESLDDMNKKMKSILGQVKQENCCMYVICIMLLLAIAGGVFTVMKT